MLYRHFPRISDREFSILTLSLANGPSGDGLDEALRAAADWGINLVWAGNDPARAGEIASARERSGLRANISLIVSLDCDSPDALRASLSEAGTGSEDFLSVAIPDETSLELRAKAGIFRAAAMAVSAGSVGAYGFTAKADGPLIERILDAHAGWSFLCADCDYVTLYADNAARATAARPCDGADEGETPGREGAFAAALRRAADDEMSLIATNPFANGRLRAVPPAVHEFFRNAPVPRSHDEWAFRGIWEAQEVTSVACGYESAETLARWSMLAEAGRANSLTRSEIAVLEAAARALRA